MIKFPKLLTAPTVTYPVGQVDTDQIIPASYLKGTDPFLGGHLFDALRFKSPARLGTLPSERERDRDFFLNAHEAKFPTQPPKLLLGGVNFGCGSSREHAPYAFADYGFRVIIAPSFADIFRKNCSQNSILLIEMPEEEIAPMRGLVKRHFDEGQMPFSPTINLEERIITYATDPGDMDSTQVVSFTVSDSLRNNLLDGRDDITDTQERFTPAIEKYYSATPGKFPWMFHSTSLGKTS